MSKPTVLITGGSGMIGSRLTEVLGNNYEVAWLVRSKKNNPVKQYIWNVNAGMVDDDAILSADHIIHLAGENIGEVRWTEKNKKKIVNSRVLSSQLLQKKLNTLSHHVKSITCASAIGIYKDAGDKWLNEESNDVANNFLAETVKKWEAINFQFNIRTTIFRFGLILNKEGGIFPELYKPLKVGVAPIFGDGKHFQSWIHIDDICGILRFSLENNTSGIYNAVSPQPVPYNFFMDTLQKSVKWPTVKIPVPSFLLKLILGEKSIVVLEGCRVSSKKISVAGYRFKYDELHRALKSFLTK